MIALPAREALFQRLMRMDGIDEPDFILSLFQYQAANNPLYRQYLELLDRDPDHISIPSEIPYLPIQLFKNQRIQTGEWTPETIFESSSTTSSIPGKHPVRSLAWYNQISLDIFESFYGSIKGKLILALLPSYIERPNSSLIHMVRHFIEQSENPESGFMLDDLKQLPGKLKAWNQSGQNMILWGVPFALLDLAELGMVPLENALIMETGGMKGRRREIVREELHDILSRAFPGAKIASEYGMTELLSQAYTGNDGRFRTPKTMSISLRQINDPLTAEKVGKVGVINVMDLANLDTCSFIATDDLGKMHPDGSFEVLGRLDASDIRGCNLMLA